MLQQEQNLELCMFKLLAHNKEAIGDYIIVAQGQPHLSENFKIYIWRTHKYIHKFYTIFRSHFSLTSNHKLED